MRDKNVGVYYGSDTMQYHLSQFKTIDPLNDYFCTNNLEDFNQLQTAKKIAVMHIPFPFDLKFETTIQNLNCDHIYVIGSELHPPILNFILRNDSDKITYYICGVINVELKRSKIYQYMDWFETSKYFYKNWLPEILTRLQPYTPKNRAFDILLGRKKLHRDEIYNHAARNPEVGLLTYFNSHDTNFSSDPDKWIWEHDGVRIKNQPMWTVNQVDYYGHPMSLSQIIPIIVYNQTAYSVVAETCFQDEFAFYTEKTAKPIIAKRLFIIFAGMNYLSNLRRLGFRTFSEIIDESYDTEPDALVRWNKAWKQVMWLSKQPQEEVLEKVRPIAEHNFNHMMSTNWYGLFSSQLEQDVVRIIDGSLSS